MLIIVPPEDLVPEYIVDWKLGFITNLSIDYATNAIHGWLRDEEIILFRFKNYGFINDNRHNIYNISSGSAGIMIQIIKRYV
jgi:hypothetical protein